MPPFLERPRVHTLGVGGRKKEGPIPLLFWHGRREGDGPCPLFCALKTLRRRQELASQLPVL